MRRSSYRLSVLVSDCVLLMKVVGLRSPELVKRPWSKPVKTVQTTGCPLSMVFHAYDPHLVVANEHDLIRYERIVMLSIGG